MDEVEAGMWIVWPDPKPNHRSSVGFAARFTKPHFVVAVVKGILHLTRGPLVEGVLIGDGWRPVRPDEGVRSLNADELVAMKRNHPAALARA